MTGTPVLLNASFNNNAEPIVDSIDDAVVSFLATNLNALIIGDYVIEKLDGKKDPFLGFYLFLPPHIQPTKMERIKTGNDRKIKNIISFHVSNTYNKDTFEITAEMYALFIESRWKIEGFRNNLEIEDRQN